MHVELGADVFANDGDKVGTVERIVIDPHTKQIHQFVVHRGFLTHHDKLVDLDMVERQTDEGLSLNLTSEQVNELPEYIEENFQHVPEQDLNEFPYIIPNAMGGGAFLYGAPGRGRGYDDGHGSFFDPAPAVAPIVETRSNIPETDVMISEGTDVIARDGEKVGAVHEVFFSPDGHLEGFLVKAGLLFTRDVRVPIDWVEQAGPEHVTLNVDAADAESMSYDVGDSTL